MPDGTRNYRYTEIPTDLLLDVYALVVNCNNWIAIDENETLVVTQLDREVHHSLEPLTKWLGYAAATLERTDDLDARTRGRLLRLRYQADGAKKACTEAD